ncbi:MAG: MFS transporter [Acidimicrobiia bacterium]
MLAALGLVPAILSATGELDTLTLFLWQLAGGVVVGMSGPSNSLLARRLAPPGQVTGFNARLSRSGAVAIIVGLLVGGALVSAVGPTWAYLADVVSYLPAVLLIGACIKRLPTPVHPRHRFREGIQAVKKTGGLRAAFVTAGLLYLLATPVISTFPALAKQIDDGANALAMLMAAYAAGGLFVATVVRRLHRRESWAVLGRRALFVSGFGLVALGLAVGLGGGAGVVLAISLVALLPTGLAVAIEFTMLSSLVELGAPEDQRSPVLTAYGTLSSVIGPIGGLAIGALADTVSVSFAVVTSGILLVLAGALTRILRFFRSLDDLDHPDAAEYAAAAPRPPTHPHLSFDHAVHHHRIPVDG